MLRALCTICADLLQQNAAACPCGHVYHYDCLKKWIKQSKTCPKCRQRTPEAVRLFPDDPETSSTQGKDDPVQLKNELSHKELLLKQKDADKKKLQSEVNGLLDELQEVKQKCETTEKKLHVEKSTNAALKKQMGFLKVQEKEVAAAKLEALRYSQQLKAVERLNVLIEGSRGEAEAMLQGIGGDSRSAHEIVTQLVVFKKECEKMKESKIKARRERDKMEKELYKNKQELTATRIQLNKSQELLGLNETELKSVEKDNISLRRKITILEKSLGSPSPRTSAITRLMRESPAPLELKRPRLTPPEDDLEEEEQDDENWSIIANTTTAQVPVQKTEVESFAEEIGISVVKMTTMRPVPGPSRPPPHQPRKRSAEDSSSTVSRTGYDGMGGHSRFLVPSRPTKFAKKVGKNNGLSKFVKPKGTFRGGKDPPLPKLNFDWLNSS